jgi:hypothetical protein
LRRFCGPNGKQGTELADAILNTEPSVARDQGRDWTPATEALQLTAAVAA